MHGLLGGLLGDHRPEIDALIESVPDPLRLRARYEARTEFGCARRVDQDALRRDADLARVLEGTLHESLHDHVEVGILGYAAKYASAFYGPFREAVDSSLVGDRKSYQQDAARSVDEALAEAALDVAEGADIVMVKPALPYLDVLRAVADASPVPVAAYQVSGEYAMVEAAAERGWLDRDRAIVETLTSIKRAGACMILSYWAATFPNSDLT